MSRISSSPQFLVEDEPVIETIISPKINLYMPSIQYETRIHFSFYSQASCNALTSLCPEHLITSSLSCPITWRWIYYVQFTANARPRKRGSSATGISSTKVSDIRTPEEAPLSRKASPTKKSLLLYILGYIVENKSLGRLKRE